MELLATTEGRLPRGRPSQRHTRQEDGPQFNFQCVRRVLGVFSPTGETSGLKGAVTRTGLPKTADTPSAQGVLGARDVRAATRVPSAAHGAELQGGSRSAHRDQVRRPENRPEAHGGGQCENPLLRPLPPSPELVGNTLLTRSVSTRSCGPSLVCIWLATSSPRVCLCGVLRVCLLRSSFWLSHTGVSLRALVCSVGLLFPLHCHVISLLHRSHVSSSRGHDVVDPFAFVLARKVPVSTGTLTS